MNISVQQVLVIVIAIIAIILVLKFMKGCIKAVVCLFILIVGIMSFVKLGDIEGITDKAGSYLESSTYHYEDLIK